MAKSLVDLSVNTILSTLTLDCQRLLVEKLQQDRVYDLNKYIPTLQPPQDGCYLVFLRDHDGNFSNVGLTCHVASLCFALSVDAGIAFHAYHIPGSPINAVIEVPPGDLDPRDTTVTVTCLDRETHDKISTSLREIRNTTQINMREWEEWECPQVHIIYWIPK